MKNKCNHIIGEWQGADEGGVFHFSDWNMHTEDETWKFCPLCGKNISSLKKPKPYECKGEHGSLTSAFIQEANKIGPMVLKNIQKRGNLSSLLPSDEKYEREVK